MEQARAWLQAASRVTALTGAGISAESGIPTFRGAAGLWRQYRPEQLASPEGFTRDPQLVWEWYDWRRGLLAAAAPNAGHLALARAEDRWPVWLLITQNVDGLHERAGSRQVIHLHGDLWTVRCLQCGRQTRDERVPLLELPPRCGACGGLLRPGVVWFGEALPDHAWQQAREAAAAAEVLLVIGTSALVYPAALLVPLAQQAGAKVIEINVEETAVSSKADAVLRGLAGEWLPELLT